VSAASRRIRPTNALRGSDLEALEKTVPTSDEHAISALYARENGASARFMSALKSFVPRLITTACGLAVNGQAGAACPPTVFAYTLPKTLFTFFWLSQYTPQPDAARMLASASTARDRAGG
jgi:hypothetical protein